MTKIRINSTEVTFEHPIGEVLRRMLKQTRLVTIGWVGNRLVAVLERPDQQQIILESIE
jgi:hypothetical protein